MVKKDGDKSEEQPEYLKFKNYSYSQNEVLVLQAQNRPRNSNEPSTEVQPLKIENLAKFGDRYRPESAPSEEKKKIKKREKKKISSTTTSDFDGNYYNPKDEKSKEAYEELLGMLQNYVGEYPDVIRSAADECLIILKDENLNTNEKLKELNILLPGEVTEDILSDLIKLSENISDFEQQQQRQIEKEEEQVVGIQFDEKSDSDVDESEEESEQEGEENEGFLTSKKDLEDEMEIEESSLNAREIDAFWIQRQLSKYYKDASESQRKTNKVLEILNLEDDSECENQLVQLLNTDKFEIIKVLMLNRFKIYYCTKLNSSKNEQEKNEIKNELKNLYPDILEEYEGTSSSSSNLDFSKTSSKKKTKIKKSKEEAKQLLDLEQLSFDQGSHLMTNKFKLPDDILRTTFKSYEEISIPPTKPKDFEKNEKLIKIEDMPKYTHIAFKGYKELNRVQSKLYESTLFGTDNILLSAPTGCGKTNVAVLCILHELGLHLNKEGNKFTDKDFKIVYIAPMKALVQEVVGSFSSRLNDYGISVQELTGDRQMTREQIDKTQVIVTTPEKWDIVTRKSGDRSYIDQVKLIIIDEIHLLHDERGPVLESIVSRTLRQQEISQEMIRLVGLSATLPNFKDVALFLRVKDENIFHFDSSYRPVPLQQQYIGVTEKKALKKLIAMNEITYLKVMEKAGRKQVLVFVHSRKDTAKSARDIRDRAINEDTISLFLKGHQTSRNILQSEVENAKDSELKDLLPYGIGIHHAGLTRSDRQLVEDLFGDGHLQVLVSTATLAWGINLPSHTVIIKGTQVYSPEKSSWTELSALDVCQMIGRAGRIKFDTDGEGIIITTQQELQYYLTLLNEQLPIESQFIKKLADNLNAEIVLGTVTNVTDAINWLSYTYLYVRMLRNPNLYGIENIEDDSNLEVRRMDLIHTAATILEKNNLIKYDRRTGNFEATDLGQVASHYYITHQSMSVYNQHLKPNLSDIELFRVFSLSNEFKYMMVRKEEKLELQKLLQKVPIPVKESVDEPCSKVNVLLQTYISKLKLDGYALVSDMTYITQSASRILRALFEIISKRGWSNLTEKTLELAKMVERRMWRSQSPLRQFSGIPSEIIKKLEKKELPWDRLYDLTPSELGELIRVPKMGKTFFNYIRQFPRLDLTAHVQPITRSILRIDLTITPDFDFIEKFHGNGQQFWILVLDVDGEVILHLESFILRKKNAKQEHYVSFTVQMTEPVPPQYFIKIVNDRWIGSETTLPVSFRHLILPEKYSRPTELFDLIPLQISALKNENYERLYSFKTFNSIQTQVFNTLYNSSNNVFIGASTGSGKTVCAEISIFKILNDYPDEKGLIVYIAPEESILKKIHRQWSNSFGNILGKKIVKLTGDSAIDSKLLESSDITLCTPENWDILSRRWKVRKSVQNVKLFIVDELHLIGGSKGPVIEVIISRMRYISNQLDLPIRILGLSSPIANGKDVAEWMGVKSQDLFNFHPNARPNPVEIEIKGFSQMEISSRILSMTKPTYYAIKESDGKPTIIFVSSIKEAKFIALEMMHYFPQKNKLDISKFKNYISNRNFEYALENRIGLFYEGITNEETKILEKLYNNDNEISILISTYSMCWNLNLTSYKVIIMGTEYYEGKELRYADYRLADMLEMIGKACRPLIDEKNKVHVFCHYSKVDYYNRFLLDPFPIESHLDLVISDHFNAEIVTKTIQNRQDAVDYLTWTLLYRRLRLNPNYYNLHGSTHRHISDYLSELVENTLNDLQDSKSISVEDEKIIPLNLGMISSYYYVKYTTIELFNSSLTNKTKLAGLLEILSAATEFDSIKIRLGEDEILEELSEILPLKIESPNFTDPHTKVNLLLQAHFSRARLNSDLESDKNQILEISIKLLQSMVDVISSNGWLKPAIAAMELSQMIIQAMWDKDPILLQLPWFDDVLIKKLNQKKINSIFDLIEMEEDDRSSMLNFDQEKMNDIALSLNRYPNIDLNFNISKEIKSGNPCSVLVEFDIDDIEDSPIHAPFYPKNKFEEWWVIIGDSQKNQLVAIKRLTIKKSCKTKVDFIAPKEGDYEYKLYFVCDSYLGCDQEYELKFHVDEGDEESEEEIDEMEEE